jgi:hypothetical protein
MDTHKLEITKTALDIVTTEQREAIWQLLTSFTKVTVGVGGFDLPDGYLTFVEEYSNGTMVYGGIAPDGRIST